jgi:hypothetical protein
MKRVFVGLVLAMTLTPAAAQPPGMRSDRFGPGITGLPGQGTLPGGFRGGGDHVGGIGQIGRIGGQIGGIGNIGPQPGQIPQMPPNRNPPGYHQPTIEELTQRAAQQWALNPPPDFSKLPRTDPPKFPGADTPPRKPAELPSWVRWEYATGLFVVCLIGGLLWGRYGPLPVNG